MLLAYYLLISGIGLFIATIVYNVCFHHISPYRHLPSPQQKPLFRRFLHEPTTFEIAQWMREVPNRGLVRYYGFCNQERILITDPDVTKEALLRDNYKYDKLQSFAAVQWPAGVSGLTSARGLLHKFHRKHINRAYSGPAMRKLYPNIWQTTRMAASCLADRFRHGQTTSATPNGMLGTLEVNRFMQEVCLDMIAAAAFKLEVGATAHPEQEITNRYLHVFKVGETVPLFLKLLQICPSSLQYFAATLVSNYIFGVDISGLVSIFTELLSIKLHKTKELKAQSSNEHLETEPDIIDNLLFYGSPHLSERALLRHALTTVAGSVEMVSNNLSWAIYALARPSNLHIQDTLRATIRNHFPHPPATITEADIKSIPYLLGVVNEIFRLYPSVPHRSRECNHPTTLLDVPIRKNTIITWPIYAMNRHPAFWGCDADEFRPERWMDTRDLVETNDSVPVTRAKTNCRTWAFMTFAQGPRKCPGEHYSRMVMACMLLGFVGRYRFTIPEGEGDVVEDDGGRRTSFGIVMKARIRADVCEVDGWDVSEVR